MSTLPPDPDNMNAARAGWAGEAIHAFQRATRTEAEDPLMDLLCDIRHWCDRNGTNFDDVNEKARRLYLEDIDDPSSALYP